MKGIHVKCLVNQTFLPHPYYGETQSFKKRSPTLSLRSNSVALSPTAMSHGYGRTSQEPLHSCLPWNKCTSATLSIFQQELPYSPAGVRVHTSSRLVQNDNLGSPNKGQSHRQLSLHSTYERDRERETFQDQPQTAKAEVLRDEWRHPPGDKPGTHF